MLYNRDIKHASFIHRDVVSATKKEIKLKQNAKAKDIRVVKTIPIMWPV